MYIGLYYNTENSGNYVNFSYYYFSKQLTILFSRKQALRQSFSSCKISIRKKNILESIFKQIDFSQTIRQLQMEVEQTAAQWKKAGNQAFKNNNFPKAIMCYTQAIIADRNDFSFYSNRAICYYNLEQYQDCIVDCDQCLLIKPGFVKALRRKGLALLQMLKFDQSICTYKMAYDIEKDNQIRNEIEDAENYKSNYNRYLEAARNQDVTEALSCINHLCGKIINNDTLKMFKVETLAKTGNTLDALAILKDIPIATASNPDTWYLKGIIQLYSGESGRAKKFFMEGMRLDPDNNKARIALNKAKNCERLKQQGNQLIKQNKYEEAEAKYTEALKLDPFNKKLNCVIYSNRALTYMKRKQRLKAIDDLNKSLELNPQYVKSLVRRAQVNMQRGEYTAASMDYSKIQQLDPTCDMKAKIRDAQKKQKEAKKKDYYKILGVDRNASDGQIKDSYKALALLYHPDRNRNKTEAEQDEASTKFKQIAQAKSVLTDKKKKQLYDSGQIDYDGDQGGMGGMGGMAENDLIRMFFGGGMGGMGGMGGFGGKMGGSQKFTFRTG